MSDSIFVWTIGDVFNVALVVVFLGGMGLIWALDRWDSRD